ncbi:MAG: DUF4340 domain-containing protein [Desulfobacterales bacterium]|nr:DUF4340 domain-containing protein [Desulfobacterales bacterium]
MKIKKEVIVLGVVIAALSVYLLQRGQDRTRYSLPEIASLAAADITQIEISRQNQVVTLTRRDGRWIIEPQGFAAAPKSIQDMLAALSGLRLTALVAESKNYALYELDDDNRIHVKAWQGDRLGRELYIGKVAPSFRHTFVRLAGDERVFHAQDNFRFYFTGGAEELRNKTVLAFQRADITEVAVAAKQATAVFRRQPGSGGEAAGGTAAGAAEVPETWVRSDGKPADGARLRQLVGELSELQCERFLPEAERSGLGQPVYTLTLRGSAEHTLAVFPPSGDDKTHPAVSSQSDQAFLLAGDQAQRLMVDPQTLLRAESKAP